MILGAENDEGIRALASGEISELLLNSGYLLQLSFYNREEALQSIILNETLIKRKPQLDDIRKGLSLLKGPSGMTVLEKLSSLPP